MGYPRTGQLTQFERDMLVNSWRKFQAGAGSAYPRTMGAVGPRGLLNIERDPNYAAQYGDTVPGQNLNGQGGTWNNGTWNNQQAGLQPNTGTNGFQPQVPVPQPNTGGQVVGANNGAAAPAVLPQLKPLQPIGKVAVSAAARCELVAQTTRIQGGVIHSSNMTDSNQALSEKFCEARGFAITQGQSLASQFAVSETELNSLCEQITSAFAPAIQTLPSSAPQQVATTAQTSIGQLGLTDAATAAAYGQICISIGYRNDNAEMALAGALTMVAAGQAPYGELMGHHLREGFGVTASDAASGQWYVTAVTALEQGAQPAFVPSTTQERILIIKAAMQLRQNQASGTGVLPNVIPASNTLPALHPLYQDN